METETIFGQEVHVRGDAEEEQVKLHYAFTTKLTILYCVG